MPIGLSLPSAPGLACPYLPALPCFSLVGCANRAPGLFHCSMSGPHRGGHWPSPLARCEADTPYRCWREPSPISEYLVGTRPSCVCTTPKTPITSYVPPYPSCNSLMFCISPCFPLGNVCTSPAGVTPTPPTPNLPTPTAGTPTHTSQSNSYNITGEKTSPTRPL